jgi:Phosphopantetheine attachment site.
MDTIERLKRILRDTLQLGQRADSFTGSSRLLGAIPEFDSMAVVTVLTMIEDEFGITVDDDEISADVFETLGTLAAFIEAKVGA